MDKIAFVDWTVFLGMHSADERVRVSSKNFFVKRSAKPLGMSLEQIGLCDDRVWRSDRETQDAFFAFMDAIQTEFNFQRWAYEPADIEGAQLMASSLTMTQRLTAAMTKRRKGILYSFDEDLLTYDWVRRPQPATKETAFAPRLERFYAASLALRFS